jgi:hypothetical protein
MGAANKRDYISSSHSGYHVRTDRNHIYIAFERLFYSSLRHSLSGLGWDVALCRSNRNVKVPFFQSEDMARHALEGSEVVHSGTFYTALLVFHLFPLHAPLTTFGWIDAPFGRFSRNDSRWNVNGRRKDVRTFAASLFMFRLARITGNIAWCCMEIVAVGPLPSVCNP